MLDVGYQNSEARAFSIFPSAASSALDVSATAFAFFFFANSAAALLA